MNKLTLAERANILRLLCEGMSIRAVTHLTGASKNTVAKLLISAGKACAAYHDAAVRNVKSSSIHVEGIWTFAYAKQKNVASAQDAPEGAGDTWTWTALDADSKMIVSYLVGDRSGESAMDLVDDLAARLANHVQLTTDGRKAYLEAVEDAFGAEVDFAQLVKLHGPTISAPGQNLTIRTRMRRFTRLTNAFSNKVENHEYAVALHMMYYNFVRTDKMVRVTRAMAAGVSDRIWEMADIAKLVEEAEDAPKKRGPYKRQGQISN